MIQNPFLPRDHTDWIALNLSLLLVDCRSFTNIFWHISSIGTIVQYLALHIKHIHSFLRASRFFPPSPQRFQYKVLRKHSFCGSNSFKGNKNRQNCCIIQVFYSNSVWMVHSAVQPAVVPSVSLRPTLFWQVSSFFLMVIRMYGYSFSTAGKRGMAQKKNCEQQGNIRLGICGRGLE